MWEALSIAGKLMKKALYIILISLSVLTGCFKKEINEKNQSPAKITPPEGAVIIALLDTGISTSAIDKSVVLEGYNYVENNFDAEDKINHGTAAASVIVGSAPAKIEGLCKNACLVPLVVSTKTGKNQQSINPRLLAQAIIDSVDKYRADIIIISLGFKKDLPEVKRAVEYAENMGVLVVAAVGNDGEESSPLFPASYETVIAVGSHDKDGKVSVFSQKNGTVDILAPGEDIWLASRRGKTYGAYGTSYACAYVSAAAANLISKNPGITPKEVREKLFKSATDIGGEGFDSESGWGILNLEKALSD